MLETPRLREFDRLRGALLCIVLLHHFDSFWPGTFLQVFCMGYGAIDLFFVMSGFLISRSLLQTMPDTLSRLPLMERLRAGAASVRAFYVRRIWRITPAAIFWVVLPLLMSLFPVAPVPWLATQALVRDGIAALTMQGSYNPFSTILGVYWSLSIEEQFYAVIPLVFLALPRIRERFLGAAVVVVLVSFLLRPITGPVSGYPGGDAFRFVSHSRFDSIAVGVLLSLLCWKKIFLFPAPRVPGWASWVSVLFCFSVLWFSPAFLPLRVQQIIGLTVFWVVSAYLSYLAALNRGYVFNVPILRNVFEYMGKRSLSIYLCHCPMMCLSRMVLHTLGRMHSPRLESLVALVFIGVAAELSYRFIEEPGMKKGKIASREILEAFSIDELPRPVTHQSQLISTQPFPKPHEWRLESLKAQFRDD